MAASVQQPGVSQPPQPCQITQPGVRDPVIQRSDVTAHHPYQFGAGAGYLSRLSRVG